MRYLRRPRAMPIDAEDLRNDIYIRVVEAADQQRPANPKAFLFRTARNLLIDMARRNRVVAIDLLEDLDVLNVLVDEATPERHASGRQQLQRLARVFDLMPPRCREVLWLRRIDGLPQKEVARRLGVTEAAVEKHVHRGMRYLADALFGGEGREATGHEARHEGGGKVEMDAGVAHGNSIGTEPDHGE